MKTPDLPAGFVIENDCLPRRISAKGDRAVLCIHGYTSYPAIYDPLVPKLEKAGFSVSVPRLPGHGTTGKDFLRSGARDWIRTCIDEYINLKSEYSEVHVLGQSMGGLLCLILGGMFKPASITLLSPAISVTNSLIKITPVARLFIKRYAAEFEDNWVRPYLERIKKEYWDWRWIAPAAELYKLIKKAKKSLKNITSPLFCIMAGKDDSVKPKAGQMILDGIKSEVKKMITLENSVHNLMMGECLEEVIGEVSGWLQSFSSD